MSTVWSSDDSKTILLTKQVETAPRRQSKFMAIVATLLGLSLVACVAFHNQIFNSGSSSSASAPSQAISKAPVDDCIAVVQNKITLANKCDDGDATCGCGVVTSITPADLAACPANLTDAVTAQAAAAAFSAAVECCSKPTVSTCDATNVALYDFLLAQIPAGAVTATLTRKTTTRADPSGYTTATATKTRSATTSPTPSNGAEGLVPSFLLGMVMLL